MHPAPSIIVFTVLSGLGLGLMAWIGLGFGPATGAFPWVACILALGITGFGGVASAGHLARPDRAWRAFSQWRSSWLSREACLMIATIALFAIYAALWLLWGTRIWLLGAVMAALAVATVYATAMIYAQLKTVPRWSSAPTPTMFLGVGLGGGYLTLQAVLAISGVGGSVLGMVAALAVTMLSIAHWRQKARGLNRDADGSTLETATGLGDIGKVRLLEPPHTGTNYLLKEMAYQVGRNRSEQLVRAGWVLGGALPLLLAGLALLIGGWVLPLALLCHIAGMMAFRWLFFAEAEQVQALYYGRG